jgi:hypothetical protein
MTAPEAVDRLVARYAGDERVTTGTGFGTNRGLRVGGRIFAIFSADGLTLKLPAGRVDELVAAGTAIRYDAGKGRPMREWVTVLPGSVDDWGSLADEALAFVSASR